MQPFPEAGGKWQISTEGGEAPRWARNGDLFFRSRDKMMVVGTKTSPTFSAERPRTLFDGWYVRHRYQNNYEVTPDGRRFLMVQDSEQEAVAAQLHVVINWFEELKRRAPSSGK